jgi:hypothetical protein
MGSRTKQRNGLGAPFISERSGERGVTILIVALAMISMLAMLALAIDVVSLYVAEGDAQRTPMLRLWLAQKSSSVPVSHQDSLAIPPRELPKVSCVTEVRA